MSEPNSQQQITPRWRLLVAGDLHLESPPGALESVPQDWEQTLLAAPFQTAQNIFDRAIAEQVDALLLAGDVVDLRLAGPHAAVFLREQFERLQSADIPIYWSGGKHDLPDAWPIGFSLPDNVRHFNPGAWQREELTNSAGMTAVICGVSGNVANWEELADQQFLADDFSVALAWQGDDLPKSFCSRGCECDAIVLGGPHDRRVERNSAASLLVAPGTPLGRGFHEAGPRTATLISCLSEGEVKTRPLPVATVRWEVEKAEWRGPKNIEPLLAELNKRLAKLADNDREVASLIRIVIECRDKSHCPPNAAQRRHILNELRATCDKTSQEIHVAEVAVDSEGAWPDEWLGEETIRGDVLRELNKLIADPTVSMGLERYLAEDDSLARGLDAAVLAGETRRQVLEDAGELCVELLTAPPAAKERNASTEHVLEAELSNHR